MNLVDDNRYSYVIFNIFFSYFYLVLIQIRGVLEQLPILSRYFIMFSFRVI